MSKKYNLKIISAGAGSGKTYRLTQEMVNLLRKGVRASGIIATTFTAKAAAELQERVRTKLLEEGLTKQADELSNALIGTVHGLGVKLLKRFAFEAGVSPSVDIIAEEDQQIMFNQSLSMVLYQERVEKMEHLCDRLGLNKKNNHDWRKEVKHITEIARTNAFGKAQLEESKLRSIQSFEQYLGNANQLSKIAYLQQLVQAIDQAIQTLENGADETKITRTAIAELRGLKREFKLKGDLYWWEIIKLTKLKVSKKSQDELADLQALAAQHEQLESFREDIRQYIHLLFDMANEAIEEFERYKKQRGLVDYTDMEVSIKDLLDHPEVKSVLAEELDLLMVDEFQDTSPIQLEIFLKLSKLAKFSVWVGDPKQSIYGFRGAEPQLMQAIIEKNGGVLPEDIQDTSWRNREDIVYCTNAIFTKAFPDLPVEQIALQPVRTKTKCNKYFDTEPIEANEALVHWHFKLEGSGNTNRTWMNNCIATSVKNMIEGGIYVCPKDSSTWRIAELGDVAILCRSNKDCQDMADALHQAGLNAAISRVGLMTTAEAKLVLACMKYILTRQDTLSVAEILLLAAKIPIEQIINDRLKYLKAKEEGTAIGYWASDQMYIKQLDALREQVKELSSSEILNLLLDELDLRRIIAGWGNLQQRMDNVDVLRKMAYEYEESCNRLHTGASLGGFLLWLNEIENAKTDRQSSGENSNAVNIMTYHKSKGLEYPIVICHGMEQNLKADVWGMEIMTDRKEVDLDDVLGGRWLRYWVNPYADQVKNTPLDVRLTQSPIYQNRYQQALAEEARLLYVGVTRARDYLVFVSREKPTKWLNRVWHNGKEDLPTLDPNSYETPWQWNDKWLTIRTEIFQFDKAFQEETISLQPVNYIEPPSGKKEHMLYQIDLTKEDWSALYEAKTGIAMQYANGFNIEDSTSHQIVSKALKAFTIAYWLEEDAQTAQAMAQAHIHRFAIDDAVTVEQLHQTTKAFYELLNSKFSIQQQFRKYPIRLHWNNRLYDKVLDIVLITPQEVILIQNSGFYGEDKRNRKHIIDSLGTWSFLASRGLKQVFPNKRIKVWINFVLSGTIIEVKIKQVVQAPKTLF